MHKKNKKAQTKLNIMNVVTGFIILIVLVPIIVVFSAGTQQCLLDNATYLQDGYNICSNMTTADNTSYNVSSTNSLSVTERTLLGLIGLFLILAFVYNLIKASGLTKKK